MGHLLGAPVTPGNRVDALVNGDQFFPAMLAAIRNARQSITLETYIYRSGEMGQRFADALAERAQAGVEVCVLIDWIGSRGVDRRDLGQMRQAGATVKIFNRLACCNPGRANHRDHRKLLIVDGQVGFIGGAGVADFWRGNAESPEHWRDAFFRVEGPVVAQMQAVFLENWRKVTGEVRVGEAFFPPLEPRGDALAQAFQDAAGDGGDHMQMMYLLAFRAARQSIRLAMAYFVPSDLETAALVAACRRGVQVEIVLPGPRMQSRQVRPASRARWGALLQAGARIYEYQPTMYHAKTLIVDDVWGSVGSANLDPRTFRYNDEANLNVWSAAFAAEQVRVFEADKARCREITYAEWKRRSVWRRSQEYLVTPMVPLL
jgi:cardiolipin synthase